MLTFPDVGQKSGQFVRLGARVSDFPSLRPLSTETQTKSQYEEMIKKLLIERNILSYYELVTFPVSKNRGYFPDFITNMFVDGRQVIIEPHGNCNPKWLDKMKAFKEEYGNIFYVIVISQIEEKELASRLNANIKPYMDEYWHIPHLNGNPKNDRVVKSILESKMSEFIRRRSDNPRPSRETPMDPLKYLGIAHAALRG
jgi:hypothetical protein